MAAGTGLFRGLYAAANETGLPSCTESNDVVKPIHAKAMPVLLTSDEEYDAWFSAEPEEALTLQRPLPVDQLKIVAKGERKDEAAA
jgi:putative SOS response-associated peptidase YedK